MQSTEDRVLEYLQQHPGQVFATSNIAKATSLQKEQLKGILGGMAKNGQGHVQRVAKDSYRYSPAPIPKQGETFTGQVVATSFQDGAIVRDSSGGSWRISPV